LKSQFLLESIFLSLAALVIALIVIELALPSFNTMIERDLGLDFHAYPWMLLGFALFAVLVGLIAGIYPALSLSSIKPAAGLKGLHRSTESRSIFRRILVIGQYTISIALIIGTAMIYNQVSFMKNKNLGFAKDQLLVIRGVDDLRDAVSTRTTLRNELAQSAGVIQASLSSAVPGENVLMENFRPEGPNAEELLMVKIFADESCQPTLGLELIAGRNFSRLMGSDSSDALLINEAAARKLGWEDAIGKTIEVPRTDGPGRQARKVIGVVRDFHYMGLSQPIEPIAIIWNSAAPLSYLSVRIETSDISHTLDKIRDVWNRLSGEAPFDYFFADERFAGQYEAEERLGKIAVVFSLLAIFVACLGLFGMASHAARRRTKEIGVRKVLGATTQGIAILMTTELVRGVLIANIIAWPIAYIIMNRWLQTFAYRTGIGLGVFVLSGVLTLVVATATVGYHALRAARANPVDSLKYE